MVLLNDNFWNQDLDPSAWRQYFNSVITHAPLFISKSRNGVLAPALALFSTWEPKVQPWNTESGIKLEGFGAEAQ